jgi:hypothetical protein
MFNIYVWEINSVTFSIPIFHKLKTVLMSGFVKVASGLGVKKHCLRRAIRFLDPESQLGWSLLAFFLIKVIRGKLNSSSGKRASTLAFSIIRPHGFMKGQSAELTAA